MQASRVDQAVDALANGELAKLVLARDFLFAAHLVGERLALLQFLDFGLSGHSGHPHVEPRVRASGYLAVLSMNRASSASRSVRPSASCEDRRTSTRP